MESNIMRSLIIEFKDRMKLSDDEDLNLSRILVASIDDLTEKCGAYNIEESPRFKELVYERSRYAYNDALEFFNENFNSQILALSLSKRLTEGEDIET